MNAHASARMLAHAAWAMSCAREGRAFRRATRHVERMQSDLLLASLSRNAGSDFGRANAFSEIRSVGDFRRRVPLATYDDLEPYVTRIAGGEQSVLTAERVPLFEPTGGSSGGTKLVPCTASLQREYRHGVDAWLADLLANNRQLWAGMSYWSVSPAVARARTAGGVPVGFDDDAQYLGGVQRAVTRRLFAVPPEVRQIEDADRFRYTTLFFLARSRTLALMSVWNPTFLTILLDKLGGWWPELAQDIAAGHPRGIPHEWARTRPDAARAREIEAAFSEGNAVLATRQLWPSLSLVSCWCDANARGPAAALAEALPGAHIQPKGLIATEAFVSFPVSAVGEAALSIRSHFFEFLPEGDENPASVRGAHELEVGRVYSVVVTTGAGFYRYRLRDLVEVVGHIGGCPLIRFVGKEDVVSDWLGEKVDERHAAAAVAKALSHSPRAPRFVALSCERSPLARVYSLFVEDDGIDDDALARVGEALEAALCDNFHYAYCRRLGQLGPACAVRVEKGAAERFLDLCGARGQRLGDVKPSVLYPRGDLSEALCPRDLTMAP